MESSRYATRFFRSFSFLRPAKTILVPGMYFFGLMRYVIKVSVDQTTAFLMLASEYAKPAAWPDCRPKRPLRFGPTLCGPPCKRARAGRSRQEEAGGGRRRIMKMAVNVTKKERRKKKPGGGWRERGWVAVGEEWYVRLRRCGTVRTAA